MKTDYLDNYHENERNIPKPLKKAFKIIKISLFVLLLAYLVISSIYYFTLPKAKENSFFGVVEEIEYSSDKKTVYLKIVYQIGEGISRYIIEVPANRKTKSIDNKIEPVPLEKIEIGYMVSGQYKKSSNERKDNLLVLRLKGRLEVIPTSSSYLDSIHAHESNSQ